MKRLILPALAATLAGCFVIGDADEPIATVSLPAPAPNGAREVVVVLPGFGDDAEVMHDRGIAESMQRAWPHADVVLASATFAYYRGGRLVERLEQDVIEPARKRYAKVWLAGASMGGAGALLYERAYPGRVAGVLLFAPFLGDDDVLDAIRAAGGVRKWDPGAVPAAVDGDNWQREIWRVIAGWAQDPKLAQRAWLVCGRDDRLLGAAQLAAEALPAAHFFEVDGGHTWKVWRQAAEATMPRMREAAGS
ncbi:MAG: alpha/beta hydrolase-fold protein [Gammaproteobacteria bacterium]